MPGRYIIVFKDEATQDHVEQFIDRLTAEGGRIYARYDAVFKGFSAVIPDDVVQLFGTEELIDFVERDGIVTTQS